MEEVSELNEDERESGGKIGGHVEVDEIYIGGKSRNMHIGRRQRIIKRAGGSGKITVMGLLDRHGRDRQSTVRVSVVKNNKRVILHGLIRECDDCIRTGVSTPITSTR